MIPSNITREHVLRALKEIDKYGVPEKKRSTKYTLVHGGKSYPPKYVISLANVYANGREHPSGAFNGGIETNGFLKRLGYDIEGESVQRKRARLPKKGRPERKARPRAHTERCPECKATVQRLLKRVFGDVRTQYKFEVGARLEDYEGTSAYEALNIIHRKLQELRGHRDFVKARSLPAVDYYIPRANLVVEFDESQHFTLPRKTTLQNYPPRLETGFSVRDWIDLCDKTKARDNDPPHRDEQRAWYDALRDFLTLTGGTRPTARLYSKEMRWCSLDVKNPEDVVMFERLIFERSFFRGIPRCLPMHRIATVCIQTDRELSEKERKALFERSLRAVVDRFPGGVVIYPAGTLSAGAESGNRLFPYVEKTVRRLHETPRRDVVVCLGIDGRMEGDIGKDQLAVAVGKTGIIAAARKFYPVEEEKDIIEKAEDHLSTEEGKPRIFSFDRKRYYIAVCYDSYGIRKQKLKNPGVQAVVNLVHRFRKGESNSYFAKHGFAGASRQWKCPVLGASFFIGRRIPPDWPTGVLWNKGNMSTTTWRYVHNDRRRQTPGGKRSATMKSSSESMRYSTESLQNHRPASFCFVPAIISSNCFQYTNSSL